MRSVDLTEFVAGFVAEADDHLRSIGANLLDLDRALQGGRASPRAVRELFRSFHTIKGLAAMVGVDPIADLAHAVETLLRNADRAGGTLPAEGLEALISGTRAIDTRVRAVAAGDAPEAPPAALMQALHDLDRPSAQQAPRPVMVGLPPPLDTKLTAAEREQIAQGLADGARALRVDFVPSAERSQQGLNITSIRERVGKLAEIVRVLPLSMPEAGGSGLRFALIVLTRAPAEALAAAALAEPADVVDLGGSTAPALPAEVALGEEEELGGRTRVVRVGIERLDEVLDHLSGLVVQRHRLERAIGALSAQGVDVRELTRVVADQGRELRNLRSAVFRLRLIGVNELLEPLPLLLRGLKRATAKEVRLEIDHTDVQLDKAVAERVFPAVVHLVRNAVDHAIEVPAERRRAGKPQEGLVRISCRQRGDSQLELVVADDGRGIDREAVARRAGVAVPASNADLLGLLARPGLSTREEVTQTSGRGLGVDIVRRIVVDVLGGELLLDTEAGKGSRFTLRLPLTMTIVDALAFECAARPFVVPIGMVEEILDVESGAVRRGPAPEGGPVGLIERRGEVVPLLSLTDVLRLPGGTPEPAKALLVRQEGAALAFGIDRMLGQKEVVVRPMPDPLVQVAGVSGSTDLGDGVPTLVLDLPALCRMLGGARVEARP